MGDTIAVGYDRTETSREAVEWAAAEAALRQCDLRIVTCDERFEITHTNATWDCAIATTAAYNDAQAELSTICVDLHRRHPTLHVDAFVLGTPCVDALCDEGIADTMLVVGASSHRRAGAFWLGSTPRFVVRHARRPVVVVRGTGQVRRVVVAIDTSARATEVLDWAIREANLHAVRLCVVHVWEYPYSAIGAIDCAPRDIMQVDAERLLDTAVEQARTRCVAQVEHQLLEGSAAFCLPTAVREGDLLVLGSRGHGRLRGGVLGSTVNSVLDEVRVPVVVLPVGAPAD